MKETKAQNQSYLRRINSNTVLNYLRKQKMSCSDLAKKMKLSNTAIAKITEELAVNNIIIRQESEIAEVGRRPIMLEINPDAGAIIIINLTARNAETVITNLKGMTLDRQVIEIKDKITAADIDIIAQTLIKSYKAICGPLKLLCVCVAAPGKIDPLTGNFLAAHRFADYKNINLKNILAQHFDCEILIHNDIKLALEGERIYGKSLAGLKNAMMLHIGYSVGSALMLGEKIYGGAHGFAGEITGYTINAAANDNDILYYSGYGNSIASLSAQGIKKAVIRCAENEKDNDFSGADITMNDIVSAYIKGNKTVTKVLLQAAEIWAKVICSIAEFLDLEAVVISGDIIKFGDTFKDIIEKHLNNNLKYQNVKVCYSELGNENIIKGGIHTAVTASLEKMLNNIK